VNLPFVDEDARAAAAPVRIASLVPSLTELVFALGLGELLVARTGYCIHPAEAVRRVPMIGGTKTVNLAKLRRLAPSHVLVNVDENRLETVQALHDLRCEWIVTHPQSPEDNLGLVDQLHGHFAAVPGVTPRAQALHAALELALQATQALAHAPPRRVLYLIWRDPWMTVARNTYLSRMLARIGWMTWPQVEGSERGASRYPALTGTEPWLATVEHVLLSSEPYAFGPMHVGEAQALCPQAQVHRVDGEALSWYGPRALKGLAMLQRWAAAGTVVDTADIAIDGTPLVRQATE
jgi:hypothetical protein